MNIFKQFHITKESIISIVVSVISITVLIAALVYVIPLLNLRLDQWALIISDILVPIAGISVFILAFVQFKTSNKQWLFNKTTELELKILDVLKESSKRITSATRTLRQEVRTGVIKKENKKEIEGYINDIESLQESGHEIMEEITKSHGLDIDELKQLLAQTKMVDAKIQDTEILINGVRQSSIGE